LKPFLAHLETENLEYLDVIENLEYLKIANLKYLVTENLE
jgi:hypothetical protein